MWLILQNASNATGDPEFTAKARTFFMWMAVIALIVTWSWLYLRIRSKVRNAERDLQPPGTSQPPAAEDETKQSPD